MDNKLFVVRIYKDAINKTIVTFYLHIAKNLHVLHMYDFVY